MAYSTGGVSSSCAWETHLQHWSHLHPSCHSLGSEATWFSTAEATAPAAPVLNSGGCNVLFWQSSSRNTKSTRACAPQQQYSAMTHAVFSVPPSRESIRCPSLAEFYLLETHGRVSVCGLQLEEHLAHQFLVQRLRVPINRKQHTVAPARRSQMWLSLRIRSIVGKDIAPIPG